MNIHPMWDQYPEIKQDLTDVLKVIDSNITLADKKAKKTIIDLLQAGGKLLRPAFFLLMGQVGKYDNKDQLIHVAASLEVLHMASLIHDDIIDEADKRRGLPTIRNQFGSKYALYTGDYLFCVCFKILSVHATALSTIKLNTDTVEKILIGELDQMQQRYNINISVKAYLRQISRKTAALFAMSCQLGAEMGQLDPFMKLNAKKIGHEIGMAFQILDDILDYTEESFVTGKPVLEDVKQGVYSLPLIYAMSKNKHEFQLLLDKKEQLTDADARNIAAKVNEYGGVLYAQQVAMKYTDKALARIMRMPDGSSKDIMLSLTKELLKRRA